MKNHGGGGAGLVDLEAKQKALKISWIPFLTENRMPFLTQLAYERLNKNLAEEIWQCNLEPEDVFQLFTSEEFWPQTLAAWATIHFQEKENQDQYIWLNSLIRINDKPVFWKKAHRNGLKTVNQVFENDGKTYKDPDFLAHEFNLTLMQINSLKMALVKFRGYEKMNVNNINLALLKNIPKITSWGYKLLTSDKMLQFNNYIRWQVHIRMNMPYDQFLRLFQNVKHLSNTTKLRSFQYRLLNLAIVTNMQLKKWNIKDSDLCTHCNTEKETIEHLFFHCKVAKTLLKEADNIVRRYQGDRMQQHDITMENVLFNNIMKEPCSLINTVILIIKNLIYVNRCLNKKCTIRELRDRVELCQKIELYNARKSKKTNLHYKKWYKLVSADQSHDIQPTLSAIIEEYNYNVTIY